jgi:hypothetical protein
VLDIPVDIKVTGIRFASPGIQYERYVLDYLHSNVSTDYGQSDPARVHQVVLTRTSPDSGFHVKAVVPLHSVTLIVLRPAEGAPVDLDVQADRYQIWAGQRAEITIRPPTDEVFSPELVSVDTAPDAWDVEVVSEKPLRLRVRPVEPGIRGQRFFTAWVRRPDWRALGRAVVEFRTDTPLGVNRNSWRVDASAETRSAVVEVPWLNRAPTDIELHLSWQVEPPLSIRTEEKVLSIPASGTAMARATVSFDADARPGMYTLRTVPNTGVELPPIDTTVYLPMSSSHAEVPPQIDGQLDEWRDQQPLIVTGQENWGGHHASRWEGPTDLTGKAWSRWDEKNLYFAFEVVDDHHEAPFANGEMHKFDCVHVGFDLRRDALDPTLFFSEDDCHYGIATADGGTAYRFWGARRREEIAKPVRVAVVREGAVTRYEVAFPWKAEFEPYAGPEAGRIIGLTILFRDKDSGEEQGYLGWGGGLAWHEIRPARFYCLQLCE